MLKYFDDKDMTVGITLRVAVIPNALLISIQYLPAARGRFMVSFSELANYSKPSSRRVSRGASQVALAKSVCAVSRSTQTQMLNVSVH